jgi:glycosyltransferase involved in cell wall biosynthesis
VKPGFSLKKLICDFFLFIKCIQLVRKYDYDLLHAVEESVFMACVIKKLFKIPYVYDMDSCMSVQLIDKLPLFGIFRRPMEWLEKKAITESLGVLAVCESLENMVKKHAPHRLVARLEDISLLESGAVGREDLRKELGINGLVVMYVGNLEKYQGIDLLLEGFKLTLDENRDIHLIVIGGNLKDIHFYGERTQQLGIADKVFFCGGRPVSRLGFYLRQADILVSPRTQGENTPMKIYSYLDSGVCVVATRLATHTQVLDDTIAYLVDSSPEEMAKGLLSLAADKVKRQNIAFSARQRVRDEYSLPAFQRKLASFYENVQTIL